MIKNAKAGKISKALKRMDFTIVKIALGFANQFLPTIVLKC